MVDYIIIHRMDFDDDGHTIILNRLSDRLRSEGRKVEIFSLPKTNNLESWMAFALYDCTRLCRCLVCIDFPAAFACHKNNKVIFRLSKYKIDKSFEEAIVVAEKEARCVCDFTNYDKEKCVYDNMLEVLL